MTKKDYLKAAEIARGYADQEKWQAVVNAFCHLFKGDNPRFDEAKFRKACALPEAVCGEKVGFHRCRLPQGHDGGHSSGSF